MPKVEKQWTKRNGVITMGWSTRVQVMKYKELQRKLNAAWTTSEEYTYVGEDSASPDTDDSDITCEATSQHEVTDEALPGTTTTSGAIAVFHMEHLRRQLNIWYSGHKN